MSTTSLLEPPQFVQYNHHSHYVFFLLGTSQRTSWDGPDTPLVSTSRKPDAAITDRAIKAFMSPKATATKRSQTLSNHELFVGGYYITSTKKVRPAILPVETEVAIEDGPASRGFVANGSNRSEMVTPQLMGDLTTNFFTIVSGQVASSVPELFTKNAGRAFSLDDIETTAPALFAILSATADESVDAVDQQNEEEQAAAAQPLRYRIVCLPVSLPITYGHPVYRGSINDDCVEAMERNIEFSTFWLHGVEAWDAQFHDAIVASKAGLGNKVPSISTRAEFDKVVSPTPFITQEMVEDDDEETIDLLESLKKRLFAINSATKHPTHGAAPAGMEIPGAAGDEDASQMTDAHTDNRPSSAIPRKPRVQLATYTEDENLVAKLQLTFAGFDTSTQEIHLAELTDNCMYVLAIQGKENRNRALASTLVTFSNDAALSEDFVARAVDLPCFDQATVVNILHSRYDAHTAWIDLEIAPNRRTSAFKIAFAAPDTKQVEDKRFRSEGTRTIEELLGQDAINLTKVNATIHYNTDMFNRDTFLTTMANVSAIAECLVKCDRETLDSPKNPLFYRFTRGISSRLTSPFGKRFLKLVEPAKAHYLYCYLSQQADTLHGLTIFPVTQPRSVLFCMTDREQDIPKTSYTNAVTRIDEILERVDKIFSNTESIPTCPLSIAYDNKQAKLRLELVKEEERAKKKAKLDDARQPDQKQGKGPAKDGDKAPRDTTGCVVYTGKSAFMPFVMEQDVSKRRCIPNIRKGSCCKKGKKCENNHEKDPLKWEPSVAKAWDDLIQAEETLEWESTVDQDKLKAHISKA